MNKETLGAFETVQIADLQIHQKHALCFVLRQYGAAALSHLATRDIMDALKATVLCVPGSRGGGRWKEDGEEDEMKVEKEEGIKQFCHNKGTFS